MKKRYITPTTVCECMLLHSYMEGNSITTVKGSSGLTVSGTNENETSETYTDSKDRGGWDDSGLW